MQIHKQGLMDPDNSVREAAVEAFADIGMHKSALALAFALDDKDASLLPYSENDHMSVLACFPALRTIPAVLNRWNRPESHS